MGFSITNRNQVVSGTRTGRSSNVTGDEPGTCKVVTGTPYAGLEQAGDFCNAQAVRATRERTAVRNANRMTGIQPGIGGSLTGDGALAFEELFNGETNVASLVEDLGERAGWRTRDLLDRLGKCRP